MPGPCLYLNQYQVRHHLDTMSNHLSNPQIILQHSDHKKIFAHFFGPKKGKRFPGRRP